MLKRLLCTWHAPEKAEEAWIPKERIVILKVAELSVLGCRGPSTLVSSPLYAVLSRKHSCCKLRAHGGGMNAKESR